MFASAALIRDSVAERKNVTAPTRDRTPHAAGIISVARQIPDAQSDSGPAEVADTCRIHPPQQMADAPQQAEQHWLLHSCPSRRNDSHRVEGEAATAANATGSNASVDGDLTDQSRGAGHEDRALKQPGQTLVHSSGHQDSVA